MPSLGTKKKENPSRMDRYTEDLPQVRFQFLSLDKKQEVNSKRQIYGVSDKG